MKDFNIKEKTLLVRLDTPAKVQDFLNSLKFNFEERGETLRSPLAVLRSGKAHCMEGALLAAYALSLHGHKPLILHLKAQKEDYDHVIAPFRLDGRWGAISKTNHAVLRYREPVYKNIRELVMSYFHEYFLNHNGKKTLRQYSEPFNLKIFGKDWPVSEKNLWQIDRALDRVKHHRIAPARSLRRLRSADKVEIKAGAIQEFSPRRKFNSNKKRYAQ
ncbi:MAG TPA: hypothetical protein VG694_03410 [Candidatus Paceibacterota bacterium]|nr:hypothetical protein [Candidatus Paceibacterota bacterium]